MTTLQLTTSVGEVVRDPGRDTLRDAVFRADRAGRGAFVVLDGDAAGAPETPGGPGTDADGPAAAGAPFLQATRLPGGVWRVEIRSVRVGAGEDHYWTLVRDAAAVAALFWSWAAGTPAWQTERWQPMTGLAAAG